MRLLEWLGTGRCILENDTMSHATISRSALPRTFIQSHRARRLATIWRAARRALGALRGAPFAMRIFLGTVLVLAVWAAVNWMVQVARKPAEILFPVSESLVKRPAQTWREYGVL